MRNFDEFGPDKPIEGGSTAIFASYHEKPLSNIISDHTPTFFDPGETDLKQKVFFTLP